MVTVAAAQIKIEKDCRINVKTILKYVSLAASKKVDFICFPETCLVKSTNKSMLKKINFDYLLNSIKTACAENKIHCIFSTNILKKDKIFNRAYVINDKGYILHSYDKMNLFRTEKTKISEGKISKVINTQFGKIGVVICWDSAYPEFVKELSQRGASIIFCPSYIKNYGRELNPYLKIPEVRSFESSCYVVNCDSANDDCARYSCICSPNGILSDIKNKEGLIISKLDKRYIKSVRKYYNLV